MLEVSISGGSSGSIVIRKRADYSFSILARAELSRAQSVGTGALPPFTL
jgi:hypothetical protein